MFGYVTPLVCELKVRDLQTYRAYYCGLCRALGGQYGHLARLTLSYDCAFLALLVSGMTRPAHLSAARCPCNPLSRKKPMAEENAALDYAAALNVLLAYHKLGDDRRDGPSLAPTLGMAALQSAARRAARALPGADALIRARLDDLSALEKARCDVPDAPSDVFGDLMRRLLLRAPVEDPNALSALGEMGYNIGKWIYLADAWNDRARDEKKGAYNVFLACRADKERAAFLMHATLSEAGKAYDLADMRGLGAIAHNVFALGLPQRTQDLLKGGMKRPSDHLFQV